MVGKAGLLMLALSVARELGLQNIHVSHLIIDAVVVTEFIREQFFAQGKDPDRLPENSLMKPSFVAEAYWSLYHQSKDGWSHEFDLRPFSETW